MAVLLVFLALCVLALLYLQKQSEQDAASLPLTDATADIDAALERLAQDGQVQSALVEAAPEDAAQKIALVFEGALDPEDMAEVFSALQQSGVDATFFFSGIDVLNHPDSIALPLDAGFSVGNNGYSANAGMERYGQESVVSEICRAAILIESKTGDQPVDLLFRQTTYTPELRSAAYACYINLVIQPTCYVGADTISSEAQARVLIDQLPRGSILCIRLSGTLGDDETAAKELLAQTEGAGEEAAVSADILQVTRWIASALAQTDLGAQAAKRIEEAGGALADSVSTVYTTERAVAFTFSGLGSLEELTYLLNRLEQLNAKAVFFLTRAQMDECEEQIRLILSYGHDLGIGLAPAATDDGASLAKQILLARETLKDRFQYPDAFLVRSPAANPPDALRAAVFATDCMLCRQQLNTAQEDERSAANAEAVFDSLFQPDSPALTMGEIAHFELGFFSGGEHILDNLVEMIAKQANIYALKSLADIYSNTEYTYTYPLADDQILESLRDKIHPGQLSEHEARNMTSRYIGAPWLTNSMLPGFTKEELAALDRKGYVPNDERAVFLSFDDWGTDRTIMALLDVLDEYDAKATFFIRTSSVHHNPNLLRAIALAGHAIASHTNEHLPLSIDETGAGVRFRSLDETERAALEADLVASYDALQRVVGDVVVDGRPALTLLFRPPTLAVSKIGLQTVLDCGYTFSVSGNLSSQDYKAQSAQKLAATLRPGLRSGSIIVMHMSDNSKYTAEALEIVLKENAARAEKQRVTFARLDDYLTQGYDLH